MTFREKITNKIVRTTLTLTLILFPRMTWVMWVEVAILAILMILAGAAEETLVEVTPAEIVIEVQVLIEDLAEALIGNDS
jgi:general stress protein CsbA